MALELLLLTYSYVEYLDGDPNLSAEERQRRDRRIPRLSVQKYAFSPFKYLFGSGVDQSLLDCCGVDHKASRELLGLFEPCFNLYTVDRVTGKIRMRKLSKGGKPLGRNKDIDAIGCLGLVLVWYRTRGSCARSLVLGFGLTPTQLYKWLKSSRRCLLYVLQHHPAAKITLPSRAGLQSFVDAIYGQQPLLGPVWAVVDGLKLYLGQSSSGPIQNQYYNGWQHGTFINSVSLPTPDGGIRCAVTNCPGAWHDSPIANYGIYQEILAVYKEYGVKAVVDSAFKDKSGSNPVIKSSAKDPGDPDSCRVGRAATWVRQFAGHGVRMTQGQSPRVGDKLRLDNHDDFEERRVVLNLMVLLYNPQTGKVGINMILDNYMSKTKGSKSYKPPYTYTSGGILTPINENANDLFG